MSGLMMEGPLRTAAQAVEELLEDENDEDTYEKESNAGMSSGEEDEIDDKINFCEENVQEQEQEAGPSCPGACGDGPDGIRVSSYADKESRPTLPTFLPKRLPGPQIGDMITRVGMRSFTRAIDFFSLFLTHEILQVICANTNLYGWKTILHKPTYASPSGDWDEVTMEEMKRYIGLIILMGFIRLPDITRYWSTATLYRGGWSCRFLSRNRFKAIASMLHLCNPSDEDASDKLTKVRPFLDHMTAACSSLYQPKQKLSIDERMVRSKGRSGIKQFMPSKPVRFGFKVWCLCDSQTGYTVNFKVYIGRRAKPSKNGLGFDVVTGLARDYLHQGYHIFFDNFFTSVALVEHLWLSGTPACGTSVTTRRGYPKTLKDKAWQKSANRGDCRYVREGDVLCLQWKDSCPVCVVSTIHAGHEFVMVRRHLKLKDGSHRPIMVRKPFAIHEYNQFMGGVDLADQFLERYSILHKCRKWWKTLFYHLIDLAVLNSFLLFKEWQQLHPEIPELRRSPGYSHLDFREELCRQLAGIADDEITPTQRQTNREKSYFGFDGIHRPGISEQRKNCKVCYFQQRKEFKTNLICMEDECNVHLCLNRDRNCFILWHTDEFQKLYRRAGKY